MVETAQPVVPLTELADKVSQATSESIELREAIQRHLEVCDSQSDGLEKVLSVEGPSVNQWEILDQAGTVCELVESLPPAPPSNISTYQVKAEKIRKIKEEQRKFRNLLE